MRKKVLLGILAGLAVGAVATHLSHPLKAQNTWNAPEWIVTDNNGTVVGGFSIVAFHGQNWVSFHNSTHNENFYLTVRKDRMSGEDPNVYYSNADCTGTAYVSAPDVGNGIASLRGSTYGLGRKPGATDEDAIVVRGTGAGADNSGSMQSRFRAINTPQCELITTSNPTVVATQVMDLSSFVRPFKLQ